MIHFMRTSNDILMTSEDIKRLHNIKLLKRGCIINTVIKKGLSIKHDSIQSGVANREHYFSSFIHSGFLTAGSVCNFMYASIQRFYFMYASIQMKPPTKANEFTAPVEIKTILR